MNYLPFRLGPVAIRLFGKMQERRASDAARTLSILGHAQERERVKAVARQMRAEKGLPPLAALEARP